MATEFSDAPETNKVSNELDEKSLHCRICLQPFKEPKLLPCFHTFCKPCLIKLVKRKGELICPTCDFPCPLHNGGVSGQEDNGFVNTVMDWISKQRSTDDDNEKSFHRLLRQKVFCSVHPTNEVNIYCQTCEVALCTDCANIKHRSDKHVRGQLQQAANEYIKELKDLVRQVREKEKAEGCKICREEAEEARKKEKEIKGKTKREEERSTEKLKTQIEKKTEQSELQIDKCELRHRASEFDLVETLTQYGSPTLLMSTKHETLNYINKLISMKTVTCSETDRASRRGKKEVVAKIIRCKGRRTSKFLYPLNVTVSRRGDLIIADAGNKRIKIMDKNGKQKPGIKLSFKPLDVAMSAEGKYLIIDGSGKKIAVHKENGDFERYLSDENVKNPYPWRIATSPADGSVYVAHWDGIVAKGTDKENHCIRKYNSNFEYVKSFGSYGIDYGQFEGPNYLHVSSDGVVYVSDWGNHRIQAFNEDGEFMFAIGSFGEGDGQFSFPEGLVTDTEGNLYACSRKKNFVQKFDHTGKFVSRIANSKDVGLKRATGLLVTEDMKVAVADLGDYSIKVFEY